ncbi:MAG: T9SS type A sorting domain-containing protein [Candidatus Lokiarchaeota archaeon]|nr:T9SS type A sorting domain-containing protein [Candidatus Lokiarchaeota archaeon]
MFYSKFYYILLISILFYPSIIYAQIPKLMLDNALHPVACLDHKSNVICSGVNWIDSYSLVAQKINSLGEFLWADNIGGVTVSCPVNLNDAIFHEPSILPHEDGKVFFAFEYMEYLNRDDLAKFYYSKPKLQCVGTDGEILWRENGIDLTNMTVSLHGGASILGIRYDIDKDIMIFWSWLDVDSTRLRPNIESTYIQKINPDDGEIILDSTGNKLLNEMAWGALLSKNGNSYLMHKRNVLCLNQTGDKVWDVEIFPDLNFQNITYPAATNDIGDIFTIYVSSGGIRGRLFSAAGEPIWNDTIIIPGKSEVNSLGPITNWGNDKWVFAVDKNIYCIRRNGKHLWNEEGIAIPDTGLSKIECIAALDLNNLGLLYNFYPGSGTSLKMQKISIGGELMWDNSGIFIMEKVATNSIILPDSTGGAYIISDAHAIYEPEIRPRGTYVEKVDRMGNVGFATSVIKSSKELYPENFVISKNYPNPFSYMTKIFIDSRIEKYSEFSIVIYNLLGKEVKRFRMNKEFNTSMQILWDGKDQFGVDVAEGVYIYQVANSDRVIATGKMTYLKAN